MITKIVLSLWEESIKNFEASMKRNKKRRKLTIWSMVISFTIIMVLSFFLTGWNYFLLIPFIIAILLSIAVWIPILESLKDPDEITVTFDNEIWLSYRLYKISLSVIKKGEKLLRNGNTIDFECYFPNGEIGSKFSLSIISGGVFVIENTGKKGVFQLVFRFEKEAQQEERLFFAKSKKELEDIKSFLEDCMKMKLLIN